MFDGGYAVLDLTKLNTIQIAAIMAGFAAQIDDSMADEAFRVAKSGKLLLCNLPHGASEGFTGHSYCVLLESPEVKNDGKRVLFYVNIGGEFKCLKINRFNNTWELSLIDPEEA